MSENKRTWHTRCTSDLYALSIDLACTPIICLVGLQLIPKRGILKRSNAGSPCLINARTPTRPVPFESRPFYACAIAACICIPLALPPYGTPLISHVNS